MAINQIWNIKTFAILLCFGYIMKTKYKNLEIKKKSSPYFFLIENFQNHLIFKILIYSLMTF
jgi:hypothetical protein